MRKQTGGILLAIALILSPATATAQYQEVPPTLFTGILSHPGYNRGGFFLAVEAALMRQTNPISDQLIALRGFRDLTGGITGVPGAFVGSGNGALNTSQLQNPGSFEPGFELTGGWRFENGWALHARWLHLSDTRYSSGVTAFPQNLLLGPQGAESFLYSPVFNFPLTFGGAAQNVNAGAPGDTFGIYNAASEMTIDFVQRYDVFEIGARMPLSQTQRARHHGLFGTRIVWMFERFKWRTVSADINGLSAGSDVAEYTNVLSQRLYGMYAGYNFDWYMGSHPFLGGFGFEIDVEGALFGDFAKERPGYTRADKAVGSRAPKNEFALVPEIGFGFNFTWYPWEAIQVKLGYDVTVYFNTIASENPVSFNFGQPLPGYDHGVIRVFHGMKIGAGFVW